jgi:hypothetical protein
VTSGLADSKDAPKQPEQPAESENYSVTIVRRRPAAPSGPRHLEVRTGTEVVQGLEFGRQANLLLLLNRDGQLRPLDVTRNATVQPISTPFEPSSHRELERALKKEFGAKFKTQRTAHYVICHNTTDAFAEETCKLVEDLYRAFTAYFGARGMGLSRPQFPMVAVAFADEAEFQKYADTEEGLQLNKVRGFYSPVTNRIYFFNSGTNSDRFSLARLQNLTTVIHEATHQIAFNTGCHRRYADTPSWLVEGLAMYFEAPEIDGKKIVWDGVGRLNQVRLRDFAEFRSKRRSADSIKSLVLNDQRFRTDSAALDAYAEAWALTYFLVNQRPAQYYKYIKSMIAKQSLQDDSDEQKLADFQAAFGRDLRQFDQSFLRYMDELNSKK